LQYLQAQYHDEFLPLITVILNGMLESLDYIRQNCLEEDPDDEEYKHVGGNGKSKLRIVLRVPMRDNLSAVPSVINQPCWISTSVT
jgi:hypothetical protein